MCDLHIDIIINTLEGREGGKEGRVGKKGGQEEKQEGRAG